MENRINIICLVGQLGNGGTEKQLYLFLKYLDRKKYNPLVIVSSNSDGCWRKPIEKDLGVRIVDLGALSKPLKFIKFAFTAAKFRPAAVISWSFYTNIYSIVPGIKYFIGGLRGDLEEAKRKLNPVHWKKSLSPKHFIVNSIRLSRQLQNEKIPEKDISVIYNIYERNPSFASEENKKSIADKTREKYGLPRDKVIVTTIARNAPEKDIPFFLDAVEAAAKRNKDFHVFFIGGGGPAYESEIRKRGLEKLFTLTGEAISAAELLPAGDIYFLSSKTEGMPNVVLEAIDAGCAVLATDVGGVEDIFRNIDPGLLERILIKERNALDAAEKLAALIGDAGLRKRLAEQSGNILPDFSSEKIIPSFMSAIMIGKKQIS